MYLSKLQLANFKNYEQLELEFSSNLNCLSGNNGVGKTNLLDAIYYLSYTKSYFNSADSQNILHNRDYFAIHGSYQEAEVSDLSSSFNISCIQKRNSKKSVKRDKKEYEKLSEHIGLIPSVMISPYDQDLIYEGSESRRKFMNNVISQYEKTYLEQTISYSRILEQRNKLLKQENPSLELFEVFNEQLAELNGPIFEEREKFIEEFRPLFQNFYAQISGEKEEVDIQLVSHLQKEIPLLEQFQLNFQKDCILQYTTVGVHKDDLTFYIHGQNLKKFGSQGQQKTFVLAMRLAQLQIISNIKGRYPILLLDDIFDKLDENRVANLIELVSQDHFGQVFLSDTDSEKVHQIIHKKPIDFKLFHIEKDLMGFPKITTI